jgi:hypothetical protein
MKESAECFHRCDLWIVTPSLSHTSFSAPFPDPYIFEMFVPLASTKSHAFLLGKHAHLSFRGTNAASA